MTTKTNEKQDTDLKRHYLQPLVPNGNPLNVFNDLSVIKTRGFYGVTLPIIVRIEGSSAQTAANFTTPFFIANRSYLVLEITERHETAGTDGGSVTLMLKKVPSGTAPASGTDMLSAGMSLKTTANTNQNGTIGTVKTVSDGDSLSLVTTGTLTDLVGVTVSILLKAI